MAPRPPPPRDPTGLGQISVWTFPRPPKLERVERKVVATLGRETVLQATRAYRILETSHPPTWYFAREDFRPGALRPSATGGTSFCEWKGGARYLDILGGPDGDVIAARGGWTYPNPSDKYALLKDHVAIYAAAMDSVFVEGERVVPQPGGFYGGWITSEVTGPFKGVPGSMGW